MTRSMTAAPEPITVDPPASPAVAPLPVALHDVTFLHWRYNPELVRPLLPPGTAPDRFDGAASVGSSRYASAPMASSSSSTSGPTPSTSAPDVQQQQPPRRP
jgi:uncharacterized protein YqjF (DUF2071 family)